MTEEEWAKLTEEEQDEVREVRPWDLLDPRQPRAHKEVAAHRLDTCRQCPSYRSLIKVCNECGCVMPVKVHLAQAWCPIGKWGAVDESD
jgi:hypothetical protein